MLNRGRRAALAAALVSVISGCAIHRVQPSPSFDKQGRWVVLPFVNLAETPQAGDAAESIAATLLRARSAIDLQEYAIAPTTLAEIDENRRQEAALAWARTRGFSYALTGHVHEWRYRAGLDNEPAVGLSVSVVDLRTDRVIWSASGSRGGWGNDTISGIANQLLGELLDGLRVK